MKNQPVLIDEFGVQSQMLGDNLSAGSPVTIDSEHHEIHCGDSFVMTQAIDLPNSAVEDYCIIVPDETTTGKYYHFLPNISSESEAEYTLYEDVIVSDRGSTIATYNRNRNSSLTSDLLHHNVPSVTGVGTTLYTRHFGSGKSAGGESRSEEFILKNNARYLLRITNATTSNNFINVELNHYIHPGI